MPAIANKFVTLMCKLQGLKRGLGVVPFSRQSQAIITNDLICDDKRSVFKIRTVFVRVVIL